jgi:hypothetical protein
VGGKGGGWGQGGEMTQALYAHMNKKKSTTNIYFILKLQNSTKKIKSQTYCPTWNKVGIFAHFLKNFFLFIDFNFLNKNVYLKKIKRMATEGLALC